MLASTASVPAPPAMSQTQTQTMAYREAGPSGGETAFGSTLSDTYAFGETAPTVVNLNFI